jgi:hypothetical protein
LSDHSYLFDEGENLLRDIDERQDAKNAKAKAAKKNVITPSLSWRISTWHLGPLAFSTEF